MRILAALGGLAVILWLLSIVFRVLQIAAVPWLTGFLVGYVLALAICFRRIYRLCRKENVPSLFERTIVDNKPVLKLRMDVISSLHQFPLILTVCSLVGVATAVALCEQNFLPPDKPSEKYLLRAAEVVCLVAVPLVIVMLLPRWLFIRFFQMRLKSVLQTCDFTDKSANEEGRSSHTPSQNGARMTRNEALKVLGLPANANFEDVQKARKEAIRKFNVDQRQNLEPHIKDLVEEKFKQVNMAYDILKADRQA